MTLLFLVLAFTSAGAQEEDLGSDKIEPGEYARIKAGLVLSSYETVQIRPGAARQFRVLTPIPDGVIEVVAPTDWAVTETSGVTIDKNGLLTVDSSVKSGTKLTVTAKVLIKEPWEEQGETYTAEKVVIVFDPAENPLAGDWQQTSETLCRGKTYKVDGRTGLGTLMFRADGSYSAARAPNTSRPDYWGKYEFDLKARTLKLTVEGASSATETRLLKTDGRFEVKRGALTISGMQLYPDYQPPKRCKVQFVKIQRS